MHEIEKSFAPLPLTTQPYAFFTPPSGIIHFSIRSLSLFKSNFREMREMSLSYSTIETYEGFCSMIIVWSCSLAWINIIHRHYHNRNWVHRRNWRSRLWSKITFIGFDVFYFFKIFFKIFNSKNHIKHQNIGDRIHTWYRTLVTGFTHDIEPWWQDSHMI